MGSYRARQWVSGLQATLLLYRSQRCEANVDISDPSQLTTHLSHFDPTDTVKCNRMFHCYKKCAAAKNAGGAGAEEAMISTKETVMTVEEAAPLVTGMLLGPFLI